MRFHHVSLLALLTLIVGSVSSPTTMARWLDLDDGQAVQIAASERSIISDIASTTTPLATTTQAITPTNTLTLTLLSSYETNVFDDGAAEIATYDPISQTLFVVNANEETVDLLDISEPLTPTLETTIVLSEYGEVANSVAFQDNLLAVAVENEDTQANGTVVFFERDGSFLNSIEVGPLPDMLTFTPEGQKVLVANEGEPSDDYTNDPEGSISVIDISEGVGDLGPEDVTTIGFTDFNTDGPRNGELDEEIRIFGPNATVAQDLEPEYITVSADSETAWVSLQENNALAILDLTDNTVTSLVGLGTKDHSVEGNGLDASDEDGGINIANWPLLGMYQPDAIATYEVDDTNYVITANEGDAREYIVG
ncbi:MAG: choice-of-anchor I family protein, partial [Chloroflexota bacterium]